MQARQADDPYFSRITPHDLRHTAASLAVLAGANVKAVQRMLGHASASMTLDQYADLFDTDLDAVADALDQRLRALVSEEMWARCRHDRFLGKKNPPDFRLFKPKSGVPGSGPNGIRRPITISTRRKQRAEPPAQWAHPAKFTNKNGPLTGTVFR